jgi:hypothetical protein
LKGAAWLLVQAAMWNNSAMKAACLHVASSDFAELPLPLAIVDDPGWIVEAAVKNR